MSSDFDPVPEERGDLQPPRRHPPTAIGTMTPPPPGRHVRRPHRMSWRRVVLVIITFASPVVLGGLAWYLILGASSWWLHALGWAVAAVATLIGIVLTWVAAILPMRDHLRARTADRLSRAH